MKTTSGNLFFYTNTGTTWGLLSTNIRMSEKVDRDILQEAVDTAMRRYPYLAVRPEIIDGCYHLVPNELPFVVTDDGEFAPLGEAATNYHLMTFSCRDDELSINFDHALCDGRGSIDPMYSVLYYYCRFKYGRDFDCPGVRTADDPIGPDEYASPYDTRLAPEPVLPVRDRHPRFSLPEKELTGGDTYSTFAVSVNQAAFMKVAKSCDSSPASMAALLLLQAIEDVHPDHAGTPVCLMPVDYREAIGQCATHQNAFTMIPLFYPEIMRAMPAEMQGTCMRGQIILQTDRPRIRQLFLNDQAYCSSVLKMPTTEEKRQAYFAVSPIGQGLPIVSYVGQCRFGEIEQFIRSMHFLNGGFGGILLEITSVGEDFGFDFSFGIDGSEYLGAYLRRFDELGIPYRQEREFRFRLPRKTY